MSKLHCACLIHGDLYPWTYVDRLYNMLVRNSSRDIVLHVFTEDHRLVPKPYVKHSLIDWGIAGAKQAWWYKLQIFDRTQHAGNLLYLDLDTVIVDNIDELLKPTLDCFYTVRDFKHLWKPLSFNINSSIMWWNTNKYNWIYTQAKQNIHTIRQMYRGDQDYLTDTLPTVNLRFFDENLVKSWRWQCLDGGYNFAKKQHYTPNAGTDPAGAKIMIFHGNPKPHEVSDLIIANHWQ